MYMELHSFMYGSVRVCVRHHADLSQLVPAGDVPIITEFRM